MAIAPIGGTVQLWVPLGTGGDARVWYQRRFGRPPDLRPFGDDSLLEWRFAPSRWELHVVEREPGGSQTAPLRFGVRDIDAAHAALTSDGIEVTAIEELPGVVRWCDFTDPWGNRLGLFSDLTRGEDDEAAPSGA